MKEIKHFDFETELDDYFHRRTSFTSYWHSWAKKEYFSISSPLIVPYQLHNHLADKLQATLLSDQLGRELKI